MESDHKIRNKGMENRTRRLIVGAILVVAVTMLVYGIYRGEVSIVLNKAVNVCLECIGLG